MWLYRVALIGGYGGYCADRSNNLRTFVVGSLPAVAALLALIPVVPTNVLWALGIGIHFFIPIIFGHLAFVLVRLAGRNATPARNPVATNLWPRSRRPEPA